MLRDSTTVVVVVRTRPRAIPLPMITMRKSIHGFLFSYMVMGLRLAVLRAAEIPLSCKAMTNILYRSRNSEKSFPECENNRFKKYLPLVTPCDFSHVCIINK